MRTGPSILAAARAGTTVAYNLSEPASVRFTVKRAVPGVRSKGACRRARGKPPARRKRCSAYVTVKGSFDAKAKMGVNRFRFTGRLRNRSLGTGAYQLVAIATDTAGNRSKTAQRAFRIKRG